MRRCRFKALHTDYSLRGGGERCRTDEKGHIPQQREAFVAILALKRSLAGLSAIVSSAVSAHIRIETKEHV